MGFRGMIRAVLGAVVMVGLSTARADVVYDNTDPGGVVGIDHCPSGTEIGDEITITDAACGVTQIELGFTGPIGNVDLVVRLRANDFEEGGLFKPGTILFDSGTITVNAANAGLNTFTVPVPNVTVPTSFTWTIQHVGGPSICVPRYNPPTIGSSDDFFWVNNLGVFWFKSNSSFADNLYARVEAGGGGVGITCPADVVLGCPGDTSPAGTGEAVGEGCGTPVVSYADISVAGCGDTETITRTWTADDGAGGVASCDQIITVVDTTAPTLAGVPGDVAVECDAVPAPASVTATDGCGIGSTASFEELRIDGNCPSNYTLIRTWSATDACGNGGSADQAIGVADTTAPVITCPQDWYGLECPADTSIATRGSASATDNCGGTIITSSDVSVAGPGATETITRTWTATDDCGHSSTCNQVIEVVDTTAPVVTCSTGTTVLWSPNHDLVPVGLVTTVDDGCDDLTAEGSLTVQVWSDETEIPDTGDGTGRHAPDAKDIDTGLRLRNERRGNEQGRVYLIIGRAEDGSGNVGFGTCTVVVPHDQSAEGEDIVAAEAAAAEATVANTPGSTVAEKIAPLVAQSWTQHGISGQLGPKQ